MRYNIIGYNLKDFIALEIVYTTRDVIRKVAII